jgi:hypothetical protein
VYFPDRGWLAFEPTPGRTNLIAQQYTNPGVSSPLGDRGGSGGDLHPRTNVKNTLNHVRSDIYTPPQLACRGHGCGAVNSGGGGAVVPEPFRIPMGVILLAAVAILALAALIVPPIRALRRRVHLQRAGPDARGRILATYAVFTERADDIGFGRRAGETFDEYEARLTATGILSNGDLELLTGLARRAAYSGDDPGPEDASKARQAAHVALHDLRRSRGVLTKLAGLYGVMR